MFEDLNRAPADTVKEKVNIFIGEFYATKTPTIIQTILGSCVAACLYDPVNRIGGMNHILLPGRVDEKHLDARNRYGIYAMAALAQKMMDLGAKRRQMVAKIFGGAHVIPQISEELSMGWKNVELVIDFCQAQQIQVISFEVGGYQSRKIFFHTDSGEVLLKRFGPFYGTY